MLPGVRIVSLLPSATEIVLRAGPGRRAGRPDARVRLPAGGRRRAGHDRRRRRHRRRRQPPDQRPRRARPSTAAARIYRLDAGALAAARPGPDPDPGAVRRLRGQLPRGHRGGAPIDGDDHESSASSRQSIEGILNTISTVGAMAEAEDEAVGLIELLRERLARIENRVAGAAARRHPAAPRGLPRVAGSAVRGRPLGARAGPSRRRLGPARATRANGRSRRRGRRVRDVEPEQLCSCRAASTRAAPPTSSDAGRAHAGVVRGSARGPQRRVSTRSTARATSAGRGRASSTASRCWPSSSIRAGSWTRCPKACSPRCRRYLR